MVCDKQIHVHFIINVNLNFSIEKHNKFSSINFLAIKLKWVVYWTNLSEFILNEMDFCNFFKVSENVGIYQKQKLFLIRNLLV